MIKKQTHIVILFIIHSIKGRRKEIRKKEEEISFFSETSVYRTHTANYFQASISSLVSFFFFLITQCNFMCFHYLLCMHTHIYTHAFPDAPNPMRCHLYTWFVHICRTRRPEIGFCCHSTFFIKNNDWAHAYTVFLFQRIMREET